MEAETELKGTKLLIVDDELLVALDLVDYLKARGAQIVGPCHTLQEAMHLIAQDRPDAAILNVEVNGEFVRPLAEALEAIEVPFVFETGFDQTSVAEITGTPQHEVVQKPFRRRDVLFALERALEARRHVNPVPAVADYPASGAIV